MVFYGVLQHLKVHLVQHDKLDTLRPAGSLFEVLRNLNFTTLLTYLFLGEKFLCGADHHTYRREPNRMLIRPCFPVVTE